jgi:single-stranded DNA-binding protein
MAPQFLNRAKAQIIGELVETPTFKDMQNGGRLARMKLQTVKHFVSKGERKSKRAVHDVVVFNKAGVELLSNFGKAGVHFIVDGEISYNDNNNMTVEVSQFGGEIYLLTTGGADAGSEPAAQAETSKPTTPRPGAAAASRPSGGLGRIGGRSAASNAAPQDDNDSYEGPTSRSDTLEDDDIPF